jgi:hypothetical protein
MSDDERSVKAELELNRRRLEAMGHVLDQWAEYEAQQLLPGLARVVVIERPSISKELAQRIHEVLLDYLGISKRRGSGGTSRSAICSDRCSNPAGLVERERTPAHYLESRQVRGGGLRTATDIHPSDS